MSKTIPKSSVWLNLGIRVRLKKGTKFSWVRKRLNELVWPTLEDIYGEDLKGIEISIDHDPKNILDKE